jgi:hypothetical protein
MDEDEHGAGDEGNRYQEEDKDDEDNEMDVDDPVRVARMSAKAWVCNCRPYGYNHCLHMQM